MKPLLIDFLNENPNESAKITAEKILHKITGLQLFAQESGPDSAICCPITISFAKYKWMINHPMEWKKERK